MEQNVDTAVKSILQVNGQEHEIEAPAGERLLDTLRNRLGLMSVRSSCDIGICGACTVLVDGRPISSCLTLTALSEGKQITTAEGLLDGDGSPDPVQQAFIDHSAFQCSYCTPGMVLTVRSLIDENPNPTDHEAREYLAGNLCRCGTYPNVLEAVQSLRTAGTSGKN